MSVPSGYFDYAAATPLDTDVINAMTPFLEGCFFNPSAIYESARKSKSVLEDSRKTVAEVIGVKPVDIIFTAGATEANNLAIRGVMSQFPSGNIVISAIEHESISAPAEKYQVKTADVDDKGLVDIESLIGKIDEETVLISIILASNEVGTVQPIAKIAKELEIIRKQRKEVGNPTPLYFHTDGAQASNYLDIHAHRLGVDMLTLNGGKMYGPKQSGILYVKSGLQLEPILYGGGQERGLRSGSENLAQIVGFSVALQKAQALRSIEVDRLQILQHLFFDQLISRIPGAKINGHRKHRLPNNLHITLEGQDNERIIMMLDEMGFSASTGSACSASSDVPSHVLKAMNLSDQQISGSLRFTMGRQTSQQDVERLVASIAETLAQN